MLLPNGKVSYIYEENLSAPFEVRLKKSTAEGPFIELIIKASAYIKQKKLGLGSDSRDLSWVINAVIQE